MAQVVQNDLESKRNDSDIRGSGGDGGASNIGKLVVLMIAVVGKNRRLPLTFDSCWRNKDSKFQLRPLAVLRLEWG